LLTSENARARSLIDILTEAGADIRQGADPALLERERELQGFLRSQARYQMELSINGRHQTESEEANRQLDQLTTAYQEVEGKLRDQNPRRLALVPPAPLSLAQIQAELPDGDTILLEYALGDERSYLWAVTRDSLRSYELPSRATIEEAGHEVYNLLTARQLVGGKIEDGYQAKVEASDRDYYDKALRLSQMLLGPVAEHLGTRRILVVSEGVLQYIPFDALPTPRQQSSEMKAEETPAPNAEDMSPLIATHEIVTLPSFSTLVAIRRERRRASSPNKIVAVLADPVFSSNDDRVQNGKPDSVMAASAAGPNLNQPALRDFEARLRDGGTMRLMHASEEADAILESAPRGTGMAAKGFEASRETAMSSLIGEYRIVHFATHGFLNSEHPELSGIVLTMVNADGSRTNGLMPLNDIYNLNLSADLVVLSACDTALGRDVKGEGLVGLTRGFMSAGSKSVVASLWKVDDRATAILMAEFYKSMLEDGQSPAAALRSAKQKMRQDKAWSAPYFWAGFVLQGEYSENISVNRKTRLPLGLAVSLVLVLISSGLIILQRRRRRSPPVRN
jgi:CHAT domain-containing protein